MIQVPENIETISYQKWTELRAYYSLCKNAVSAIVLP